jgi:arabinofuranosyltransferase
MDTGVVDERACYEEKTSLLRNLRRAVYRTHDYYTRGTELSSGTETVVAESAVGMTTYAAGSAVTFIDTFGIDDAFLAHIPYRPEAEWRIGHFVRPVPAGYVETVRTGQNKIEDRCLRQYYDVLRTVIAGPLFTAARWKAIVALNFGVYDALARGNCSS